MMFFFQAEDGIRDLVRSRGLGDVYKRQTDTLAARGQQGGHDDVGVEGQVDDRDEQLVLGAEAVSYTHLTLPTSDLV